jgi:hypothetical protein
VGLAVGWGEGRFECLDGVQGLELRIRGICLVMGIIGGVVFASWLEVGAEGGSGVGSDKVVSENYNQA